MKKRILCALLAAIMMVGLFAGCDGTGKGGEATDLDMSALEGLEYPMASKEPLTLTAHYPSFVGETIESGKLAGEKSVYAAAAEKTNVQLVTTVGKDQDATQAFNLMLLEDTLPDIIKGSLSNINAAGYIEGVILGS